MLQNGAANEGGGVQCEWYDALVSNCVLSNNSAVYGGGICYGTLDNSLVITNFATEGGGCYFSMANNCLIVSNVANSGGGTFNATLNNCTVEMNLARTVGGAGGTSSDPVLLGAGNGYVRNSIVVNNWDTWSIGPNSFALLYIDNYGSGSPPYQYCCTASSIWEAPSGPGNILADPAFVDFYHLSIYSPCRGAGNQLYASGADYDGNLWNDPPSMGCSEVVISNLVGPLSVAMTSYIVAYPYRTNVLVSLPPSSVNLVSFTSTVTGRAASLSWNFGDGPAITNADYQTWHYWTNTGVYNVVFTAYNDDNPEGISTNLIIYVVATNSTTTTQITWTPIPISYGTALSANQLNAAANVAGSFAYNPTNGAVLNAGTNTLSVIFTPTDTVDYSSLTDTVSLVVSPAVLTVIADNASRPDGQANPAFAGTIAGVTNGDDISATYTCGATSGSPPGTYPIVPSLVDPDNRQTNYTVTLVNGTLAVGQVPLVMWTNPVSITYGSALSTNQLNATANVPGSFAYNPTYGTVLNTGTNTLSVVFTPTDTVDYGSVTNTVSLVVSPALLTVTAANASRTYGMANPVFAGTVNRVANGDNLTATYTCGATFSSPPGTYPIVPSLVDPDNRQTNYTVTLINGTLTVGQTNPLVMWTNPAAITYGAPLSPNQLNATANVPGNFEYNPINGTVLNAGTNTLSVIFTPTDTVDYYSVTDTVSLVVSPAVLTVIAANASWTYGQANPVFLGTLTGVTNGDNITATYICGATPSSPPGTYPILPSLVDPDNRQTNYNVVFVNGTLTVWQAIPLATWTNPASITYGVALSTNQLNATASVPGSFAYNPTNGTVLNTGTYTLSVVFTPTDTVDYSTVFETVSVEVSPAVLTVTAANASRAYGQANPAFAGSVIGVTNGDNLTAVFACNATPTSSPGSYPIVPSLVDPENRQTNYTVTLVNGVLTVTQPFPPFLSYVFAPPNLTLSWPTNASAFTLIGTPSLDGPIVWTPLTNGITVNGTNETITINPGSGNQYYKLTAP